MLHCNNNNTNTNTNDNVYGAVIMTQSLREFIVIIVMFVTLFRGVLISDDIIFRRTRASLVKIGEA